MLFFSFFLIFLTVFYTPFSILFPSSLVHPSHSRVVMVIRLQVPRLALRRRLNALSGSVSRPTPWRRRPIAFLCYVLSASALRPLANRVRAAVSWLDRGKGGGAVNACVPNELMTFFCVFGLQGLVKTGTFSFRSCLWDRTRLQPIPL